MAKKKSQKTSDTSKCCAPSPADEEKWKVESAASTLKEMQKIRDAPGLLRKAKAKLAQDQKDIAKILKSVR